jgi:site-specific DNA-methyltransferase (adenine-specific)
MGIELSASYVRKIEKRLHATMIGDPLDGPEKPLQSAPTTANGRKRGTVRKGKVLPASDRATIRGVINAYRATSRGKSTDYILCDPELNLSFVEACKKSGLSGNAFVWNRLLLRARKSGRLPRSRQNRTRVTFQQMDSYSFASEIAMRLMELDYGLTLDDVLCRPEVAQEFDDLAQSFAPDHSAFEYRWAALAIRKRASQSRKLAVDQFSSWLRRNLPKSRPLERFRSREYERPGVYIVQGMGQQLYVGETLNVSERIHCIIKCSMWNNLHPTSVSLLSCQENLHGLQSILVGRSNPLLNTQLLFPNTGPGIQKGKSRVR